MHPSLYSSACLSVHPSIHSFIRSFVRLYHSFIHSLFQSVNQSSIHPSGYLTIHPACIYTPCIHPSIHPSTHPFLNFVHLFARLFVHSFAHSSLTFTCSFNHSVCLHVCPSVIYLHRGINCRSLCTVSLPKISYSSSGSKNTFSPMSNQVLFSSIPVLQTILHFILFFFSQQCFWICITFLVCIVAVVFIGWSISLNSNLAHEKPVRAI